MLLRAPECALSTLCGCSPTTYKSSSTGPRSLSRLSPTLSVRACADTPHMHQLKLKGMERVLWLRALTALAGAQVQLLAPTQWLTTSVAPVPKAPPLSPGLCGPQTTCGTVIHVTCGTPHTHKINENTPTRVTSVVLEKLTKV